ncbi:FemAB family XrtA/PEP-CTERM system-associated protein [Hyphococcus sp.]|uniref:FemAB family XrtA/PEP-CTERM system-associated protein n=1 Tax=Hyphococcus sp. TaxID=2038636 RepID=UPI002086492F|nr:MAG: peptidoglycan bridge formation protein FemAB [Marinicaulis sp.]
MTAAIKPEIGSYAVSVDTHCNTPEWDAFVRAQEDGTFFQLSAWGAVIKRAYGYDTYYLTARNNGEIAGILSLTDARTPLLGRSLISTAFSVGGGPLVRDQPAFASLLHAAEKLGAQHNVQYIECRAAFDAKGWHSRTCAHAYFQAPLLSDENKALQAIPRKRRAEVRKAIGAEQSGDLSIRHDGSVDEFYKLYALSVHRLGTPVFPKRFLVELLSVFEKESEISVVSYRGEPMAALVSFYFDGAVLPYYVGTSLGARDSRAFDYLYWAIMRRAVGKGCTSFDFGRSKLDSGAYRYKKLWGFEPSPVQYQVKLIAAAALPDVSTANPKFSFFSSVWPKLPAFAANHLGPLLAPNFP